MVNIARLPKASPCIFCFSRVTNNDITNFALPFYRQLRGKKQVSREPKSITVKLLRDVVGYGPQGSIVKMVPGRMRNHLYPKQYAAYIPEMQLRQFKKQGVVFERDMEFGKEKPEEEEEEEGEEAEEKDPKVGTKDTIDVEIKLLSPQRATEIISTSLPPLLAFYRTPIVTPEPEAPQKESPKRVFSSAAADLAAASALPPKPQPAAIFGSVSSADIAESVKALLGETEEGARVVLGPEDITIIREEEGESDGEADRLKSLGEFEVAIQIKGGSAVRRTISIRAEEES